MARRWRRCSSTTDPAIADIFANEWNESGLARRSCSKRPARCVESAGRAAESWRLRRRPEVRALCSRDRGDADPRCDESGGSAVKPLQRASPLQSDQQAPTWSFTTAPRAQPEWARAGAEALLIKGSKPGIPTCGKRSWRIGKIANLRKSRKAGALAHSARSQGAERSGEGHRQRAG